MVRTDTDTIVLELDVPNPGLSGLMRAHGAGSACLATAFNPFSQARTPAWNEAANARLRAWLEERGWPILAGEGCCDDGEWAPEQSFLAFGPGVDDAKAICVRFDQNAVVFAGPDAVPRLLFHPGLAIE